MPMQIAAGGIAIFGVDTSVARYRRCSVCFNYGTRIRQLVNGWMDRVFRKSGVESEHRHRSVAIRLFTDYKERMTKNPP